MRDFADRDRTVSLFRRIYCLMGTDAAGVVRVKRIERLQGALLETRNRNQTDAA